MTGSAAPEHPFLVLVTGSRAWRNRVIIRAALIRTAAGRPPHLMELIVGDAGGADWRCFQIAATLGWAPRRPFPADWPGPCAPECRPGHRKYNTARSTGHCPTAGHRRNGVMVARAAAALPDATGNAFFAAGELNRGSTDCSVKAVHAGIPVAFWCDRCGPEPAASPCAKHQLAAVLKHYERRLAAA